MSFRIERFFDVHFERHPVDATFVGRHEHDHRLPPIDGSGVEETVSVLHGLLADSEGSIASPGDGASAVDAFAELDRRLARGFLKTRLWEYASGHVLGNPSAHVSDAVFGLMGPLLSDYAPIGARLEAVESRLAALPAFLEAARIHVGPTAVRGGPVPVAWTRRAIRECEAGVTFIDAGVEHVLGQGTVRESLGEARRTASEALAAFSVHLRDKVLPHGTDDVACGPEAFELYLREGHFLDRSADDVVAYARDEMLRTRSWLEQAATDLGEASPEAAVAGLADAHPSEDEYLARFGAVWREMRDLALDRDLVTWPDFPIEYVERPSWARAAAPDLYFLFYRSPAAFGRPDVHRYLVAPLEREADDDAKRAFLRANNDSVIKLNHVVHHGGIGHHVQNWHAFRAPSAVGRVAAVDCASRIAMFCGGTMAEGWACYATDLMAEAGGLTEREQFAEHHGRVRMCARAIVDVELHHGRMTLAEAARFYREEADMSPGAAEAEAVKNSMFPGAALMYLVGTDLIHELRSDLIRALGDDFTLRGFHDAFLSYGSIPVKLIADEMRRRASGRLPLGAHDDVPHAEVSWMDRP